MVRAGKGPLFLLFLATAAAGAASADDSAGNRLQAVRDDLRHEREAARAGTLEVERLLNEIRSFDDRLLEAGRNLERLEKEEAGLESEYRGQQRRLLLLETERGKARQRLGGRLTGIYKEGRLGSRRAMARAAASTEPLRMARYLAALSLKGNADLRDYERARLEHQRVLETTEAKRLEVGVKREGVESERRRYRAARVEKAALLEELEEGLGEHLSAVGRLENVEEELQKITGSSSEEKDDAEPARSFLSRIFARRTPPPSFAERRGELAPPVKGTLLVRFGEQLVTGAALKGLLVRADADREVRAVAFGEVVFSGPFPGLGSTVILNHGDRFHTVYARLGSIHPQVGEEVADGEVLGVLAPVASTLHFELRGQGKAIDPTPWIKGGYAAFGSP